MPLRVQLTAPGLKQIQDTLKKVGKTITQSKIGGVELVGRPRNDGETFENVLEYLAEGGRDFVSLNDTDADKLAEDFANAIEFDLTKIFKKIRRAQKAALAKQSKVGKMFGSLKAVEQRQVDDMVGRAFKDMMAAYQTIFVDRLNKGTDWQGVKTPVTPEYGRWRLKEHGVDLSVVGKATGQLLENATNPATIRPTRRQT